MANKIGCPQYFAQYFLEKWKNWRFSNFINNNYNKRKSLETIEFQGLKVGADSQIRTGDLILTKMAEKFPTSICSYLLNYEKAFIYRPFQTANVLSCTNENKQKVHKN